MLTAPKGHTHKDEFEITYSDYTAQSTATASMMSYICPALTPTSGEPAFRVYSIDPVTFGVLDMTEYITSLEANGYQTTGPIWKEYYSAKATYGPLVDPPVTAASAELTPAFWHDVTAVLESDAAVFDAYYARKSRGYDVAACTGTCVTNEICQLRAAESQYNCVTITPGIDFRKRDGSIGKKVESGECSGSKAKSILSALVGQQQFIVNEVVKRGEAMRK